MPTDFFRSQFTDILHVSQPSGVPVAAALDDLYVQPSAGVVLGSDVSQTATMHASIGDTVAIDPGSGGVLYTIAAMLSSAPLFSFTSNPNYATDRDALVSVPAYMRLMAPELESVEDLPLAAWHLRLHQNADRTARRCLLRHISACGIAIDDFESRYTGTSSVQKGPLPFFPGTLS